MVHNWPPNRDWWESWRIQQVVSLSLSSQFLCIMLFGVMPYSMWIYVNDVVDVLHFSLSHHCSLSLWIRNIFGMIPNWGKLADHMCSINFPRRNDIKYQTPTSKFMRHLVFKPQCYMTNQTTTGPCHPYHHPAETEHLYHPEGLPPMADSAAKNWRINGWKPENLYKKEIHLNKTCIFGFNMFIFRGITSNCTVFPIPKFHDITRSIKLGNTLTYKISQRSKVSL